MRVLSLGGGGGGRWSQRSVVAERIPSEGSERARGLGESAGLGSEVRERLGESTEARRAWWRGDSEGAESLVARRL